MYVKIVLFLFASCLLKRSLGFSFDNILSRCQLTEKEVANSTNYFLKHCLKSKFSTDEKLSLLCEFYEKTIMSMCHNEENRKVIHSYLVANNSKVYNLTEVCSDMNLLLSLSNTNDSCLILCALVKNRQAIPHPLCSELYYYKLVLNSNKNVSAGEVNKLSLTNNSNLETKMKTSQIELSTQGKITKKIIPTSLESADSTLQQETTHSSRSKVINNDHNVDNVQEVEMAINTHNEHKNILTGQALNNNNSTSNNMVTKKQELPAQIEKDVPKKDADEDSNIEQEEVYSDMTPSTSLAVGDTSVKESKIFLHSAVERLSNSPDYHKYQNNLIDDGMDGNSYFYSYFLFISVMLVVAYLGYYNKKKIFGLILEGRSGRRTSRERRPSLSNYRKLDSNLDEAISSPCDKYKSRIIY